MKSVYSTGNFALAYKTTRCRKLKHHSLNTQDLCLPCDKKPNFIPIQNNEYNYNFICVNKQIST